MLDPRFVRVACALAALSLPLAAQGTIRVTAGLGGAEPDGKSGDPSTSRDGRFVVFASDANNLVPNDTSSTPDVFLYDRETGVLELISVRIFSTPALSNTKRPAVSDDGNLVCFESSATNLVPGDDARTDIFLRDRAAATTTRLTAGWNNHSSQPSMTPDGRYVAFASLGTNVVPSDIFSDVFRLDRQSAEFVLVSQSSAGEFGNRESFETRISPDGRYVAFYSLASNLVAGDSNLRQDIFVRDTVGLTTERVNLDSSGAQLDDYCFLGSLSADASIVCFESRAMVTGGDTDLRWDVFARDRVSGAVVCVSTPASGIGGAGDSYDGRMSGDARWVVFRSTGADLGPADPTPGELDAYLKDLQTGAVEIVSLAHDGTARATSPGIALSDDARWIVFASATSFGPGDAAGHAEIYLRDRGEIVYTTPCAGDGSGVPCPCGNPGQPGNGCENFALSGGVRLSATGSPSITNDTLRLQLDGFLNLPTPIAFVQGDLLLNGGLGVPFGDGVQCVGGSTVRFGRRVANGGSSAFGAGVPGDPTVSGAGNVGVAGVTRYYQSVYFNLGSFCGQLRRNWSNSIAVVWAP